MPDHKGYRAKSRSVFKKKRSGMPKPTKLLQVYKLGDYVTIKMDSAIHKGMAHRIYQGKTGVVWNVTKNAVGVLLKKRVGNRLRTKKVTVRVEHVMHSGCRLDFLQRCRFNREYAMNHKKDPKKFPKMPLKRLPAKPDGACLVDVSKCQIVDLKIQPHVDKVEM
mmetsp:Transcript_16895/g.26241  ORF Transcript_16895/g.26241 Transcript_16895/m.26241 type:complete len:164 (+) Transcript_16895:191-682(+)|eukprot:CAMPEP_0202693668 /NCGR_PEP_ID=MMETSP1385-20130828/7712_1 /ASSEMBLY_ACC=CAM_ASM_000861 /TAXON_ID=933848 /ORGANISM="Elphidium margaritaceum" /LENGTH=163 /DNA_ID=CAMNT_0049349377 /DNA_START=177 /DNA_END=668 /DNA_ORIENTATION=+